jgi:hypothetical protein
VTQVLEQYEEARGAVRQVFLMTQEQIDYHWPNILRILGEVPGYYDFFTPEWTYAKAKAGDIQVWGFLDGEIRGIALTQILIFPAQKAFEILAAGGVGMLDFVDGMEDVFERIASQTGCQTVIARVRPGLARMLARSKGMVEGAVWIYRPVGRIVEN